MGPNLFIKKILYLIFFYFKNLYTIISAFNLLCYCYKLIIILLYYSLVISLYHLYCYFHLFNNNR